MNDPIKRLIKTQALGSYAQGLTSSMSFGEKASVTWRAVDVRGLPMRGASNSTDVNGNPPWRGGVTIAS